MRWPSRRASAVPSDLRVRLGIPARERILAWGGRPHVVAATERALYVEEPRERLGWDVVSKAQWDDPLLTIQIAAHDGRPARTLRLRVEASGDLPAAVRDRVTASVVMSEFVDLGDGVRARMVARRAGDDAPIRWTVVFESGVPADDPELQARASAALAELRSTLGI